MTLTVSNITLIVLKVEKFLDDVSTDNNIEVYMNQVIAEMKKSNRQHVKEGIFYYGKEGFKKR